MHLSKAYPRIREVSVFLGVHSFINALLVLAIALTRHQSLSQPTLVDNAIVVGVIGLETACLFLPSLLGALLLSLISRRASIVVGTLITSLIPVWVFVDLEVFLTLDLHLYSRDVWEILLPIVTNLQDFITDKTTMVPYLLPACLFVGAQVLSVTLATAASRTSASPTLRVLPRLAAVAVLADILFLFAAMPSASVLTYGTLFSPETSTAHPLGVVGLIRDRDSHSPGPALQEYVRCQVAQIALRPDLQKVEERYRGLRVTQPPARTPDVVLVIAENLLADAIAPLSAPNLSEFGKDSLVGRRHFSTGNCSEIGWFGALYGLDPAHFERMCQGESVMPPAVTTLLKQSGYRRGFLGTWVHWKGLDRMLTPKHFDFFEALDQGSFDVERIVERDRKIVERAVEFLDRNSEAGASQREPLFLVVQLYLTHYSYYSEPVDHVFSPFLDPVGLPPFTQEEKQQLRNRYLNSVHCLDRLVKPLLRKNQITIILGDHGETFGEDGKIMHNTKLSLVQAQTGLIVHVPGETPRTINQGTSHLDVVPTILDALGTSVNDREILPGRSLLDTAALKIPVSFSYRGGSDQHHHVLMTLNGNDAQEPLLFEMRMNPWKTKLSLSGRIDQFADPVQTTPAHVAAFEQMYVAWLKELAGRPNAEIGEDPMPTLLRAIGSPNADVRLSALACLGVLGPEARAAIPELLELSRHEDEETRTTAREVLSQFKSWGTVHYSGPGTGHDRVPR